MANLNLRNPHPENHMPKDTKRSAITLAKWDTWNHSAMQRRLKCETRLTELQTAVLLNLMHLRLCHTRPPDCLLLLHVSPLMSSLPSFWTQAPRTTSFHASTSSPSTRPPSLCHVGSSTPPTTCLTKFKAKGRLHFSSTMEWSPSPSASTPCTSPLWARPLSAWAASTRVERYFLTLVRMAFQP